MVKMNKVLDLENSRLAPKRLKYMIEELKKLKPETQLSEKDYKVLFTELCNQFSEQLKIITDKNEIKGENILYHTLTERNQESNDPESTEVM